MRGWRGRQKLTTAIQLSLGWVQWPRWQQQLGNHKLGQLTPILGIFAVLPGFVLLAPVTVMSSSSFSDFFHEKDWRRVVSLSNNHDLPLLQPLHWYSSQSIPWRHLSNVGVVDYNFSNLAGRLAAHPWTIASPDFRISVQYNHKMPILIRSPEVLCQLLIRTQSIHSSCVPRNT